MKKQSQKEETSRVKALNTECNKIIQKIGALVGDLQKSSKHKSYSMIPSAMQQRHQDALSTLESYKNEATKRIQGDTTALDFVMKDVQEAWKTGTRNRTETTDGLGGGGREEGDMALVGMVRDEGGWRGMRRGRAGRRGGRGRGEDMGDVRGGMGV